MTSMTTIYDIAAKTGLSASTVARALNGNGYCSQKSKELIFAVADEMGYAPHQAAKTLKSGITKKIMMCIPDIKNPYYFAMIQGVTQTLEQYGYSVLLGYTMHSPEKELEVLHSLKERFVDGLIFGSFHYSAELIQAIHEAGLPTAITSFYDNGSNPSYYDCVYVDQALASWTATRYCLERGHTQIAFLAGNPKEQNTLERYAGYRRALEEYSVLPSEDLIISADFTREGASHCFKQFIENGGNCTAVVACNDLMGVGCMNACRELSLNVPEDISILSLDNTDYCLCTNPPMTSVDMMQGQVGAEAARFVMDRILNKRIYRLNMAFSPNLIVRGSVKNLNFP